jgi:hypothetical protein
MADQSDALVQLVQDVKTAIQDAQEQTPDILVTKAELTLKTTTEAGPGLDIKLGPVEIGGHYTTTEIQTLTLVLVPMPKVVALMSPAADALTASIVAINAAAREAARAEPRFGLDAATVSLNLGIDKGGKVTAVFGGGINANNLHTLTLTLKPKP